MPDQRKATNCKTNCNAGCWAIVIIGIMLVWTSALHKAVKNLQPPPTTKAAEIKLESTKGNQNDQ